MLTALHGFTETDEVWSEFLTGVPGVHCPLLPGHGWKPCPTGASLASVAAGIAKSMTPGGDLLGYSLGGRVALQLALDHPQLVRRLILVSSGPGLASPAERVDRIQRDERLAQVLEEDGIGPFVAWWESNPALKSAAKIPRKDEEALRCTRLNQDPTCLAMVLRQLSQGRMDVLSDRLPQLKVPVLLITGESDKIYAARMRTMASILPQATLRILPGCGHAVHRERPDALRHELLSFLIG